MLQGNPVTTWRSGGRQAGARHAVARCRVTALLGGLLALLCGVMPALAQQFVFTRYTQTNGLRNLGIEALLVDHAGDLWVATDGGMYRYDGTSFTPYDKSRGIPADAALALAESPTGRIFARVDAGLYSGDADHFEPLLTAEGPVLADQYKLIIATADDQVLYVKDGLLMQARRTGGPGSLWKPAVCLAPGRSWRTPRLPRSSGILQVEGGTLWFGCGLRLCRFDGRKLAVFGAAKGVPEAQYGALLLDRSGASGRAAWIIW